MLISGCSSGFGLLAAVEAARRGHKVVATLRDLGRRAALDQAARAAGVELDVLALDVNDAASIERCVAEVLRRHGRIDAAVN
ncbi:MAG: SDR family NAD(P)-dependent oxidoreductase, partial [Deltaproteobacteria bacterium]|nr:SDR family NAD(P)-dependent oxidoreductase [Deltaproteobacteria bacterium]